MPVVLKCHQCAAERRMIDDLMVETLQSKGMLKRDKKPDLTLVRELLVSISDQLQCDECHNTGVEITDDWSDDWDDQVRCEGCKAPIDPERLEIFPDTKFCPHCQSSAESGGTPGEEVEFCSFCGGILKLTKRGGAGLAGYRMTCSDCGKH